MRPRAPVTQQVGSEYAGACVTVCGDSPLTDLIQQPLGQPCVSVNPPVTQERPVRASDIDFVEVHRYDEVLLFVRARFGEDLAGGARHETLAPELNAVATGRALQADAVGYCDIT